VTQLNVSTVAILDLGTARTKMLVASSTRGAAVVFFRESRETGLGALISTDGMLPDEASGKMTVALEQLTLRARELGATRAVMLATSAFREAKNGSMVLKTLERSFGPINLLSEVAEGRIFFEGLRTMHSRVASLAAVDIGGGSVQVATEETVISLPLGTFLLERMFQRQDGNPAVEIAAIERHVEGVIEEGLTGLSPCRVLVMGSNVMGDFIRSAYSHFAGSDIRGRGGEPVLEVSELSRLYESLRGRQYDTLAEYFPQNPFFMRGADKALAICLAVARHLGVLSVLPTNESVSTALARLLLRDPSAAGSGLSVFQLV